MTTANEIKKELNAYFKAQGQKIKFSVKTRRVSCSDEIKISWTGGAFKNEVWEIVKKYHTLVDKSDAMTDYFFQSGTEVKLERLFDDADVDFILNVVAPVLERSGYDLRAEQSWDEKGHYIVILKDGSWVYSYDDVYMMIEQYKDTGAISEPLRVVKVKTITEPEPEVKAINNELATIKNELIEVMQQMKEYLDIQIEILLNFEPSPQQEQRLKSLDQEFGIEMLNRRKAKLQDKLLSK